MADAAENERFLPGASAFRRPPPVASVHGGTFAEGTRRGVPAMPAASRPFSPVCAGRNGQSARRRPSCLCVALLPRMRSAGVTYHLFAQRHANAARGGAVHARQRSVRGRRNGPEGWFNAVYTQSEARGRQRRVPAKRSGRARMRPLRVESRRPPARYSCERHAASSVQHDDRGGLR